MSDSIVPPRRAGWSIPSYCDACNFSRATFYNLPDNLRPRSLKIGKRHIVIEPPGEYLARLASAQQAA
jgi:hypothetical protein